MIGSAGMSATSVEVDGANQAVDCISGEPIAYVAFFVPEAGGFASLLAALASLAALRRRIDRASPGGA